MKATPSSVFVVDDDPIALCGMTTMLRAAGYQVEPFSEAAALLARLQSTDRGCVLVDLVMTKVSGLDLQKSLVDRGLKLPIVFMSGRPDVSAVVAAIKHGALDFLCKPVPEAVLRAAVDLALKKVAHNDRDQEMTEQLRAMWSSLTPAEQAVCRLSAQGLLNKQIAAELGSAISTVHAQRVRAFKKLAISNVSELALLIAKLDNNH